MIGSAFALVLVCRWSTDNRSRKQQHFSLLKTMHLYPEMHVIRYVDEVQGWRRGESTRAMWPGFDSQIWRHMWFEFVGSLLCTERFSPGTPVSPLLKRPPFDLICANWPISIF